MERAEVRVNILKGYEGYFHIGFLYIEVFIQVYTIISSTVQLST